MKTEGAEHPGEPLVLATEFEIWHDQPAHRHRELQRSYYAWTPEGRVQAESAHGDVFQWCIDGTEARSLRGWDPVQPFTLPLEFGRNAAEFGAVVGGISVHDPTLPPNSLAASAFLWQDRKSVV